MCMAAEALHRSGVLPACFFFLCCAQVQPKSRVLAVAFDNETWASFTFEQFAEMASRATGGAKDGVFGVIFEAPLKVLKVCAYLREQLSTSEEWDLFGRYVPAAQGAEYEHNGTPPILDELLTGMPISVTGSVVPVQARAPRNWDLVSISAGNHYHFLGFLRGRGTSVASLRWALVSCSLDNGEYLAAFDALSLEPDTEREVMPAAEAQAKIDLCLERLASVSARRMASACRIMCHTHTRHAFHACYA